MTSLSSTGWRASTPSVTRAVLCPMCTSELIYDLALTGFRVLFLCPTCTSKSVPTPADAQHDIRYDGGHGE